MKKMSDIHHDFLTTVVDRFYTPAHKSTTMVLQKEDGHTFGAIDIPEAAIGATVRCLQDGWDITHTLVK